MVRMYSSDIELTESYSINSKFVFLFRIIKYLTSTVSLCLKYCNK